MFIKVYKNLIYFNYLWLFFTSWMWYILSKITFSRIIWNIYKRNKKRSLYKKQKSKRLKRPYNIRKMKRLHKKRKYLIKKKLKKIMWKLYYLTYVPRKPCRISGKVSSKLGKLSHKPWNKELFPDPSEIKRLKIRYGKSLRKIKNTLFFNLVRKIMILVIFLDLKIYLTTLSRNP